MNYQYDKNIIDKNIIYTNIENENNLYVFEIKITTLNNTHVYRKIAYNKEGVLLEFENNIKKIKIKLCKINNINDIIIIRKKIYHNSINDSIILNTDNLVIILSNVNDNIKINYMII